MMSLEQRLVPLSKYFSLAECCHTAHTNIDNTPGTGAIFMLGKLCTTLLDPLRERFGPLFVASGYRCRELNALIGGVPDSAHIFGCAADVVPISHGVTVTDMVTWLRDSNLSFDQAIDEGCDAVAWCHVGMLRPGFEPLPRRECLTYRNGVYSPFQKETT